MTTICFRDGIFAADSLVNEDGIICGYTKKIHKCEDLYYGVSGNIDVIHEFGNFLLGSEYDKVFLQEEKTSFSAIVVDSRKKTVVYYTKRLKPEISDFPFHAIGSGKDIARGALLMGASAKKAVECAAKLDGYTGGKIQVVRVW